MAKDTKNNPTMPIMVVDDEQQALINTRVTLEYHGYDNIILLNDSREVKSVVDSNSLSVILLDLSMPYVGGHEILEYVHGEYPSLPVIIVTAANDVETAVECMRDGAFDYMVKPVEENRLVSGIRRAVDYHELEYEYELLVNRMQSQKLEHPDAFTHIITQNTGMYGVLNYIETVSVTGKPILITGETGTGKELAATAIHKLMGEELPYVTVNVAGLDDHVFSDTLFGHVKGAFTGAEESRNGLIQQAGGGILFLDEIGDLSQASQVKLLRLIQQNEYLPLGADTPKRSTARIIAATNADIQNRVESGDFRKDLYYRLHTHHIHLPPLRERLDDLPLLLDHFLASASEELGKKKPTAPPELKTLLSTYAFPGNVRELEAMVFEAVSSHTSMMLSMDTFKTYLKKLDSLPDKSDIEEPYTHVLEDLPQRFLHIKNTTDKLVREAIRRAEGNQTIAAELLGISRPALSKRLKKLDNT